MALMAIASSAISQNIFRARIQDATTKEPLIGATANIEGTSMGSTADINGIVEIVMIPDGSHSIEFRYVGYKTLTLTYVFPITPIEVLQVSLRQEGTNLEEVVVSTTRSSRSIDDIATRIETITSGELEEKAVMQPASIRMLLTESTGIQTQQTSVTSASTSVRIQGLDGKYTQMLKDGFPLYSGFAGGLSILQIPPLDLMRVEVIKGSASTLYGGGAIAGLINLVTKVPTEEKEISLLVNTNQTNALDLSTYYRQKFNKWGVTLYGGRNSQAAFDRNHDGFSDIPKFTRYTLNPRIFRYGKTSIMSFGVNTSFEERMGGDMSVIEGNGDSVHTYFEKNKSNRYSSQFKFEKRFQNMSVLTAKNSVGYFARNILLSDFEFLGSQVSSYSEISYLTRGSKSEWIGGINLWTDRFRQNDNSPFPLDYHLITSGFFAQNNYKPAEKFTLETGVRIDYNNHHDAFVLPRISLMWKFSDKFTSRIGGGLGYKPPSLFSEEAETKSFRNIEPLDLSKVKAEKSIGGNVDFNYKTPLTDEIDIIINQLFFYTSLNDPLILSSTPGSNGNYFFYNVDGTLISSGFETNLKLTVDDFSLYAGYTYINATRDFNNIKQFNPLTAKHRLNLNLMYEIENKLRVAYELFYVGPQYLSTGELTRAYWVMGLSAEKKFQKFSLFVNAENFLDSRQTRYEPLYTGSIQNPQFKEVYSPIDGFIFNGGFKIGL